MKNTTISEQKIILHAKGANACGRQGQSEDEISENCTDKNLHRQFIKLGNDRRKLTNELLALLPEIYERGIYKKYAGTIVEYAGKFGGLSKGVVIKRLRLEKYLKDKPKLKEMIKTGGVHKVALVANLATKETEDLWIDKIENMSKDALQELSKELRSKDFNGDFKNKLFEKDLFGESFHSSHPCKAVPGKITIELDEEMSFMFMKLKKKIGEKMSNKEVMRKILEITCDDDGKLQKIKAYPEGKKEPKVILEDNFKSLFQIPDQVGNDIKQSQTVKPASRYIPMSLKRFTLSKTEGKCAYPNCQKPAELLHHTDRFAESRSHQSILPFCKTHHEFSHNGLIENEKNPSENWQLNINKKSINKIDKLYRKQRKLAQI